MLLSVARHRFSEDICVIFQLEKSYSIPLLPPLFLHVFLYSFYTKANLRLDDPGPPVVKPLPQKKKKIDCIKALAAWCGCLQGYW